MKKLLSIALSLAVFLSLFASAIVNTNADTVENPNPQAAQISSVQAIRNSLKLVWNDEFGGDIGCGAQKQALVTTNGTDENGNPTSSETRASAKWAHERYRDGTPKTRNGQLQHYVIEDGRNSWTEDGVLHIRGQREENGHVDPVTHQSYSWTADGLRSSYFDTNDNQAYLQAFRFGMMEARIYNVNGKAREDEDGNPVLDKDGNIQQDPKYSQGLWNGFWTTGNPDMSKENSLIRNKSEKSTWPYCGEIDINESYNSPSGYSTYNSSTAKTDTDANGIIITYGSKCKIKYDNNGKILITDKNDTPLVTYNSETSSYDVAEGYTSDYTVSGDKITIVSKTNVIKQDENGKIYISDKNGKTVVDTEGNCYGTAPVATAQLHYQTGERFDGTSVTGTTENKKTTALGGGYRINAGSTGQAMHGDTGYHTYGVYWTPTQLVYYYDDLIVGYHDITDPQFFQLRECPQYLFLTFPIGGSVPGNPNPALDWAEYLVDYVRVYQADDGYNTDENYQGSYGFPQLNDLDQDISYYSQASNAYSDINVVSIYNSCELTSGAEQFISWTTPFRTSGKVCSIKQSSGIIKTKEKFAEGKYDVYLTGVSRSDNKDYNFTINGVGVGTKLKLSDYAKDKYNREYGSAKSAYIGTANITNGAHNLEIGFSEANSGGSKNGQLLSFVLVKNDESTATVTVNKDTTIQTQETSSTSTTTSTTAPTIEGKNYNITVSQKEKYVSNRTITNDPQKENITMILVIGQSNATTGVGYPCELKAIANGHRDEVTEVTTTPEANTVFMAKYGQTLTSLNSNDVATLIENDHIGGFSASMGKKWHDLTGEKVVIVQAAKGARGMHEWVKDNTTYSCMCGHNDALYSESVNQFNTCYNALKDNYNIKHSFYIWNQGEHDDNYYSKGADINSKEKYYEAYKSMHEDLLADLPLDFGSINIARSHYSTNTMFLSVSRLGQYKAINTLKGCYLASRLFETTTSADMDQTTEGSSGIHATQKTYNAWGKDAAENLYDTVSGNSDTLDRVEIIKNVSKKGETKAVFNANGELISGSDVLTQGEQLGFAVEPHGDWRVTYSFNGDKSKVDAFGTADDSVFSSGEEVKIRVTKYNGVLPEEQETTTQVELPVCHLNFNPKNCDFTYVENGMTGYYNKQGSYEHYRADDVNTGDSVVFTTKQDIKAGKYKVTVDSRPLASGRAKFNVTIGGKTAELNTNTAASNLKSFDLFDEITVSQTSPLVANFTATSDGIIFLYRMNLVCTELFDDSSNPTDPTEPTSTTEPSSSEPSEPTTTELGWNVMFDWENEANVDKSPITSTTAVLGDNNKLYVKLTSAYDPNSEYGLIKGSEKAIWIYNQQNTSCTPLNSSAPSTLVLNSLQVQPI